MVHVPSLNIGMKVEIPEFEGNAPPDVFIDWLHTMERVFDLKDLSEEQKVKIVAIKLRKYASVWWERVKRQQNHEGKSKVCSWEKMKRPMRKKFLPAHLRQETFLEYHGVRQGDKTVEDYTSEFNRLCLR